MASKELYYRTTAILKVGLNPDKLNGKLDENILVALKNKYENITSELGIIVKINSILEYDYGRISDSTFTATTYYDVKCDVYNCNPIPNLEFYAKITRLSLKTGRIILENGPTVITVQTNEINNAVFEIKGDSLSHKESMSQVKTGDIVKLSVINSKGKYKNNKIVVIAKLLDIAGVKGTEKYEYDIQNILNINVKNTEELI